MMASIQCMPQACITTFKLSTNMYQQMHALLYYALILCITDACGPWEGIFFFCHNAMLTHIAATVALQGYLYRLDHVSRPIHILYMMITPGA